eukprot:CAMPEP_0119400614 /NCGR_PEP_ID=MMETSP1334-20130426/141957_1 /TAXON_ID=127549 /ORGANISM="Calcidiscus leptoporus, Strain RCC1130" /LENGTH=260 /DNA_ID=CAMNT_0007424523 /DNA_START=244 /DNA_END=1027 /DNA_ORIENTATION=-
MGADVRVFNPRGLPVRDPALEEEPKVRELRSLSLWSEAHVWVSPEMHGCITGVFKNQSAPYRASTTLLVLRYSYYATRTALLAAALLATALLATARTVLQLPRSGFLNRFEARTRAVPSQERVAVRLRIDWLPLNTGSVRPTQGRTAAVLQVNGGSQSFNAVNELRRLARWMRMPCTTNQSSVAKAWQEFDECGRMKPGSFRERVVDVMEEHVKFTRLMREHADFLVDRYSERREIVEKGKLLTQAEKERTDRSASKAPA